MDKIKEIYTKESLEVIEEVKEVFALATMSDNGRPINVGVMTLMRRGAKMLSGDFTYDECKFTYKGINFIATHKDDNSIVIVPYVPFLAETGTASRWENEKFILFKIKCADLYEVCWDKLFSGKLSNLAALNVANYQFELGASCWWDSNVKETYVLIHKGYLENYADYRDNGIEYDLNFNGTLQYAILSDDRHKVGFIWNKGDGEIMLCGDEVGNLEDFVLVENNVDLG